MVQDLTCRNENHAANDNQQPVLRSRTIRTNDHGLVCLNDIWAVAGSDPTRRPAKWLSSAAARRLTGALRKRIVRNLDNSGEPLLHASTKGRFGLSHAHVVLAQAYCEYLDADLAVEVREVFLRYRAGDASLADEILERASVEENRRVAVRAMGRVTRGQFTDVLQEHGVRAPFYAICTDTVYRTVLDKPAAELKRDLAVPKAGSLRDALSTTELAAIALAESFSADRIKAENRQGGPACQQATATAARNVRDAMDAETRSRRLPPPPPANDDGSSSAA